GASLPGGGRRGAGARCAAGGLGTGRPVNDGAVGRAGPAAPRRRSRTTITPCSQPAQQLSEGSAPLPRAQTVRPGRRRRALVDHTDLPARVAAAEPSLTEQEVVDPHQHGAGGVPSQRGTLPGVRLEVLAPAGG